MLRVGAFASILVPLLLLFGAGSASASGATKVVRVSHCPGQNAEVEQAVDGRYVYEAWIGCNRHIGFARSVNGGRTFGRTRSLGGRYHGWDPAVAVAPDGTVYVAYMVSGPGPGSPGDTPWTAPQVSVSVNHGRTFSRRTTLPVSRSTNDPYGNWGDREFIAVGPDGAVYVTWDYGPSASEVKLICTHGGSCSFSAGDFNAVVQKSTDGGRTWTMPAVISPGYPLGGVFSAPIVVEPDGTLDVLYMQSPTDPSTLALSPGGEYFTRSTDGGATWSTPVAVDPQAGTLSLEEWWIDGSLALDPAGNLYAAWDTQSGGRDVAWLAWSSDGGQSWSAPLQVASSKGENLVEVAAAGTRNVYVGLQAFVDGKGYVTRLRRLAVGRGWTGPSRRVSHQYGNRKIWPGDTFGISTVGGTAILSWGGAPGRRTTSQIYAARPHLHR
jgi:BNR repeat-like domain